MFDFRSISIWMFDVGCDSSNFKKPPPQRADFASSSALHELIQCTVLTISFFGTFFLNCLRNTFFGQKTVSFGGAGIATNSERGLRASELSS